MLVHKENAKTLDGAIMSGDLETVKKFYSKDKIGFQADKKLGAQGLVHMAIAYGTPEITIFFINEGAPVNLRDDEGQTPLHYVQKLTPEIVKMLLEVKADPNIQDNIGNTPLWYALWEGSKLNIDKEKYQKIVKLLLENGAKPDIQNEVGRTPLYWIEIWKDKALIELLKEFNINI